MVALWALALHKVSVVTNEWALAIGPGHQRTADDDPMISTAALFGIPLDSITEFSLAHLKGTAAQADICLLYTSPSPRDATLSRMPSSA